MKHFGKQEQRLTLLSGVRPAVFDEMILVQAADGAT